MSLPRIPDSLRRDRDEGMRRILPVALALLSTSCVVRQYGGTAPVAAAAAAENLQPVDFSGVEKDLELLISAETENVDRRDRLEAAWELCQRVKTQRPAAQHAVFTYLERLVSIERRIADAATDALANPDEQSFVPIASITAERIADSAVKKTSAGGPRTAIVPPDAGAAAVMDAARERMASNDLEGAIEQLAVCQGQPCGAATVTLWQEARDRLVYQRREAAGAAFISASKLPTKAERVKAYGSVQANLKALQTEYPDSRYKDGVAASLQTVANAIDAENQ